MGYIGKHAKSGNMNFVVSTACIKMKMTPEEAINAATINGAYAMGLSETHGSITKGKVGKVRQRNPHEVGPARVIEVKGARVEPNGGKMLPN